MPSTVAIALRSIPAHAGEPGDSGVDALHGRVYPRARGGATSTVDT